MATITGTAQVIASLGDWQRDTIQSIYQVFIRYAARMEARARSKHLWKNRTGQAETGLTGTAELTYDEVTAYLYNVTPHGLWLEIAMGRRFEIIWSTVLATMSSLLTDLSKLKR